MTTAGKATATSHVTLLRHPPAGGGAIHTLIYWTRYAVVRETGACMEAFLRDNPNIRLVWTPDSQTRVNVSRYNSAAVSQMVINLRLAQYLTASATGGDQELQNLQRQASELQQVRPHAWDVSLLIVLAEEPGAHVTDSLTTRAFAGYAQRRAHYRHDTHLAG